VQKEIEMSSGQGVYHDHAIACGVDMTGKCALPLDQCLNRWTAAEVLHPETQDPIVVVGWWILEDTIDECKAAGVDYLIVEA
jgi:hypothetical protein